MNTLTRAEAHDLVAECATLEDCYALQRHWIGHADTLADDNLTTLREMLSEYVDACADDADADDTRSNGPKDSDDTGLTAP